MFCPLAPEWGDFASWFSGIASFAAVLVALYFSSAEVRATKKRERQAAYELLQRDQRVISEAARIAAEVEGEVAAFMAINVAHRNEQDLSNLLVEILGLHSQFVSLQSFPMSDPRIFTEIGRMAHDCQFERNANYPFPYNVMTAQRVSDSLKARREAIMQLI